MGAFQLPVDRDSLCVNKVRLSSNYESESVPLTVLAVRSQEAGWVSTGSWLPPLAEAVMRLLGRLAMYFLIRMRRLLIGAPFSG